MIGTVLAAGVLAIIAFVVLIGAYASTIDQRTTRTTAADDASYTMKAADLFEEYEQNEVAADRQYKGHVLAVSGLVKHIGLDVTNTAYVVLGENRDNPFGTQAMFDRSAKAAVAALSKGQRITVLCRGGGKLVNVILRDCELR